MSRTDAAARSEAVSVTCPAACCEQPVAVRGLCRRHYTMARLRGLLHAGSRGPVQASELAALNAWLGRRSSDKTTAARVRHQLRALGYAAHGCRAGEDGLLVREGAGELAGRVVVTYRAGLDTRALVAALNGLGLVAAQQRRVRWSRRVGLVVHAPAPGDLVSVQARHLAQAQAQATAAGLVAWRWGEGMRTVCGRRLGGDDLADGLDRDLVPDFADAATVLLTLDLVRQELAERVRAGGEQADAAVMARLDVRERVADWLAGRVDMVGLAVGLVGVLEAIA